MLWSSAGGYEGSSSCGRTLADGRGGWFDPRDQPLVTIPSIFRIPPPSIFARAHAYRQQSVIGPVGVAAPVGCPPSGEHAPTTGCGNVVTCA